MSCLFPLHSSPAQRITYDIRSSDGALLATHAMGDKPTLEPQGLNKYHWLIVRPADGAPKSLYNLFLKNPGWPKF